MAIAVEVLEGSGQHILVCRKTSHVHVLWPGSSDHAGRKLEFGCSGAATVGIDGFLVDKSDGRLASSMNISLLTRPAVTRNSPPLWSYAPMEDDLTACWGNF